MTEITLQVKDILYTLMLIGTSYGFYTLGVRRGVEQAFVYFEEEGIIEPEQSE